MSTVTTAAVFAADGAQQVANNAGKLMSAIGIALVVGIIGFALLVLLPGRKIGQMVGVIIAGMLVAAFFIAPGAVMDVFKGTVDQLTKGA